MKDTNSKLLSMICVIFILISTYLPTRAAFEEGILRIKTDTSTPKHQALTMTVSSIPSDSSLQGFCVGWTFTFTSLDGKMSTQIYVPLSEPHFYGGTRSYTFPLTTGWTLEFTGIAGGKSIRDLCSYQWTFDQIIKNGCNIHADASIRKYSYSNGKYTPLNIYAKGKSEIDSNFSEFSYDFKNNTKNDYFDLSLTLAPEPAYTNNIHVIYWDKTTEKPMNINQEDISVTDFGSVTEEFSLSADIPEDYEVTGRKLQYTSNMPTNWADYNSWDKKIYFPLGPPNTEAWLNIQLTKILPIEPDTGNIYIKCLDYATNAVISSSTVKNIPYGVSQNISAPQIGNYLPKGSYSSFSSSVPQVSAMQSGVLSQSIILTIENTKAYVYFWYDGINGPVAFIDGPTKVRAGDEFELSGSRSYCKQPGAKIVKYDWSEAIDGESGTIEFGTPGKYTVKLTVTDSNGLTASTTHEVEVTPPTPTAKVSLSGKIKENRKITVDSRESDSPDNYRIDWAKTSWHIEPDLGTGATWKMGVRLKNGMVIKIDENTDQSFLKGQEYFYFQARYAGKYKVTLSVTNTYPESDTFNGFINVSDDLLPVADYEASKTNYREYGNPLDSSQQKFCKIPYYDKSYSPDGDPITGRIWCFRYNSNNNRDIDGNPDFSDDVTQYRYEGDLSVPYQPDEGQRLIVENDNDTNAEIWSYDVGQVIMQLIVQEGIPDNETIKELLLPTDYRHSELQGW